MAANCGWFAAVVQRQRKSGPRREQAAIEAQLGTRVVSALSIDTKPGAGATGSAADASPNPGREPLIVLDAHEAAPVGFGLRENRAKKSAVDLPLALCRHKVQAG